MLWRGKGNNQVPVIKPEDDKVGRTPTAGGNGESLGGRLPCFMVCVALLCFSIFFFLKGNKLKDLDFNKATER